MQSSTFKWIIGFIAILLTEYCFSNLNKEIKTKLYALQLIIEGVLLFIGSRYVWRTLTFSLNVITGDTATGTVAEHYQTKEHIVKSQNLFTLLFKSVLFIYLILSFISYVSYATNAFPIGADPNLFIILCYVCLGALIQQLTSLLCIDCFVWFYNDIFCHLRKSSRKINVFTKHSLLLVFSVSFTVLVTIIGFNNTTVDPKVKTVQIALPKLSMSLRLVQLSDIHLGPTTGRERMSKVVDIVNGIKPDIVVITGDLVDATVADLKNAAEPVKDIKTAYGKFFVTGNHEYHTGHVDQWFEFLRSMDVTVLHNENKKIQFKGQDKICIAGVDDLESNRIGYEGHGMDLDKALKSCDPAHPLILLAHQPNAAKMALQSRYDINLILSGHTHGGQFYPLSILIYLWNAFYAGLYKISSSCFVYVTQGTFYWGVPIRLGSRMEISHLILNAAL